MKKGFVAIVMATLLSLFAFAPAAFAADMNSNEQKAYDEFCAILDKFEARTNFDHAGQYKSEAKRALLDSRIDLDANAYSQFSSILKQIDGVLADCNTQGEAWKKRDQIIPLVNSVANKYKMNVTVDAKTFDATVTIDGDTVASTGSVVKQTGFSMGEAALMAAVAAVALGGAFYATRKNNA